MHNPDYSQRWKGRQLKELSNPAPTGGTAHHQAKWRCKGQRSVDGPPRPFDQGATTPSQGVDVGATVSEGRT